MGELRVGLLGEGVDATAKTGNPDIPEPGHHRLAGLTARFAYDTIDKRLFATEGTRATASLYSSQPELGADRRYQNAQFALATTRTSQRNVWQLGLRGGSDLGSHAPYYDQFKVGGLFNFSGYRYEQLVGREYALAGLLFRRRAAFLNETLGTAVYSGLSLEVGNVYKRLDGTPSTGVLLGGALFLAIDSKIGPIYLAYGRSEGGRSAFYLYLGSSVELYAR